MIRKTLAIIWKDIIIRFSSRSELLFFIILPVIFTAILGGGINFESDADNRVRLPVVDEDRSAGSVAFLEQLSLSTSVRPETVTASEGRTLIDDGDVAGLLVIPAGFGSALSADEILNGGQARLALQIDPASNYGLVIEQALQQTVGEVTGPLQVAAGAVGSVESVIPFSSSSDRIAFFDDSRTQAQEELAATPIQVAYTVAGLGEDYAYEAAGQASAGQLITWVLIPLLATSALMAYERTSGTLRRLLVTPSRKGTFLLGTLSGQLLMSLVQMGLLIGFGALVMGVNWGTSPVALVTLLVAFGLAGVAMGTMMGTFTKSDNQAGNLSIMLGMVMALLGGCWWPMELFPEGVQTAVKVLPTTWAMQGLTDITLRGQGMAGVALESAVLVGFATVFFIVGVARFRYE